jgi:hypothetical protein
MWILIFSIMYAGSATATTVVEVRTQEQCQWLGARQKAEVERASPMARAAFTCTSRGW